jgi:hypothetical protein
MNSASRGIIGRRINAQARSSFAWNLSDVAAVLTYIRNSWGNAASPDLAKDVASLRTSLQP